MKEILKSIEKVLSLGCGVTLEEVLVSERYKTLKKESETLFDRHLPESDIGLALLAGHLEFGRLVNTVGERMALTVCKDLNPILGLGVEFRPLVQLVGEHLVSAATDCLTPELKAMAKSWKGKSADQQIEICEMVYQKLISNSQKSKGDLTFEILAESMESNRLANRYDHKKVLPRQYGLWDADSNVANCQGKSQMITAFARLAGAKVIIAHPLKHASVVMNEIRKFVYDKVMEDIKSRNITRLDKEFTESLQAGLIEFANGEKEYFHVCGCIELVDGRWVLIDPHALNFGVFSDKWNIATLVERLERYKEVLPGLSIYASDNSRHKELFGVVEKRLDVLFKQSRELEEELRWALDPMDLAFRLRESGGVEFMLRNFSKQDVSKILDEREMLEIASITLALGPKCLDLASLNPMDFDQDFLLSRIHTLITAHHCVALNEFKDKYMTDGSIIHPECELTNPEYSLAISAINSLVERYDSEVNRFFMDYSFDQTSMYNALGELMPYRRRGGEEIGLAAARSLKALPYRHANCRDRLEVWSL